jgi:hypothetical protein
MTNAEILMTSLTAVIAVGGIIGACIFYNQLAVMKGQLVEMKTASKIAEESLVATQRPWVSVKLAIGPRGLFFDPNGANLDLIFSLKNTGPTPAVNVRIVGSSRIDVGHLGPKDRISELEKMCADATRQPPNPKMSAQTIFPGETLDLNITYSFANKELLDLVTEESHGFILPVVIGCIDYFFTFGEPKHHQSRFVYDLDCPIPGSGGSRAIKVSDGDKSTDLLRLTRWFQGGSFQAD